MHAVIFQTLWVGVGSGCLQPIAEGLGSSLGSAFSSCFVLMYTLGTRDAPSIWIPVIYIENKSEVLAPGS